MHNRSCISASPVSTSFYLSKTILDARCKRNSLLLYGLDRELLTRFPLAEESSSEFTDKTLTTAKLKKYIK